MLTGLDKPECDRPRAQLLNHQICELRLYVHDSKEGPHLADLQNPNKTEYIVNWMEIGGKFYKDTVLLNYFFVNGYIVPLILLFLFVT